MMSIKSRFCVKCGKEIEATLDGLCHFCYMAEKQVQLPREIEVKVCPKCGATLVKKIWLNTDKTPEEFLKDEIKRRLRLPEHARLTGIEILELGKFGGIRLNISVAGTLVPVESKMAVILNKFCCPDCSRQRSDWMAKIQVRSSTEPDMEELLTLASKYRSFIIRTKQQKRGMDVFFFNHSAANKMANDIKKEFRASISKTYEQHGHDYDTGQPKHREVILIKI